MNGCIFTGARAICALGRDHPPLRALSRWHGRFGTPVNAILGQSAIAVALIALPSLDQRVSKAVGSGFEAAVEYTAPVFWAFLLLTGAAVVVLRARDPAVERPFRVPLYPATVVVFCLMCAHMLYSSLVYTKAGALVGVGILLLGVPLYVLCRRRGPEAPAGEEPQCPEPPPARSGEAKGENDPCATERG
jgi:APA family basic amino acid/polyamine antiporter